MHKASRIWLARAKNAGRDGARNVKREGGNGVIEVAYESERTRHDRHDPASVAL